MKRSVIENRSVRNKKLHNQILKGKKDFWKLNVWQSLALELRVIVDVITYHAAHKYCTFCFMFHMIGTYLWKLQENINSIPRYRMAFFTYRLWSVNCDLPEIWSIWACLQVTCEGFILLSQCEQLNFVEWAKVSLREEL